MSDLYFFAFILKSLGPIFFFGLQVSSIKEALDILKKKTTGDNSLLPYASLFVNCVIWTYYGLLNHDFTVFFPNFIGVGSGAFCLYIYKLYEAKPGWGIDVASFSILLLSTSLYLKGNSLWLGYIGCSISIILSGSPLATIRTVIQDKSTVTLPFWMCVMNFANSLSWTLYGSLVASDIMIYGPNLISLFLAMLQLSLFVIYGFPTIPTIVISNTSSRSHVI